MNQSLWMNIFHAFQNLPEKTLILFIADIHCKQRATCISIYNAYAKIIIITSATILWIRFVHKYETTNVN